MKKIIKSLFVVVALGVIATAATVSYFSSNASLTENVFGAGTLDLQLRNDNAVWGDGVTSTWVSPEGWAPGQEFTGTIHMTNVGSIDSNHVYFKFLNLSNNSPVEDGSNLSDKIIITNITERFNDVVTPNQAAVVAANVGNRDNVLTLAEFAGFENGYYSLDDMSSDNMILAGNNKQDYDITFTFRFADDAGNEYQGDGCGFNLNVSATQNAPTAGMIQI